MVPPVTEKINSTLDSCTITTECNCRMKYMSRSYVCVMVSPNRNSRIVAPRPETRMYGTYRNITPHRALHRPLQRINASEEADSAVARGSRATMLSLVSIPRDASLRQQ